jgi:hypothetical protein
MQQSRTNSKKFFDISVNLSLSFVGNKEQLNSLLQLLQTLLEQSQFDLEQGENMLVSTFELLVKPQLPKELQQPPFDKISRTVIQGYFLTLANTTNFNVRVSLVFTALSPILDPANTITFLDILGDNVPGDVDPSTPGKTSFPLTIPANDTGLFILQPDPALLTNTDPDFEVRGYVEIFLSSLSPSRTATLLLTPEHRGTFFKDLTAADPQLDQIIYPLPTATGSSLFRFRGISPISQTSETPQSIEAL